MSVFRLLLIAVLFVLNQQSFAQDTLAYEVQRKRVNDLLEKRSARFGQFNQSLQARTGIFGLKTKKDMQASIDILKEIVNTDNHIFKETKVLLDYKDMEKTFISYQANQSTERINGYVNTISKQQRILEQQEQQLKELQQKHDRYFVFFLLSLLLAIALSFVLIKLKLSRRNTSVR